MVKIRTKIVSPKMSFKGWKTSEFLKGLLRIIRKDWSMLKEVGKVVIPAVLTWLATQDPVWTIVFTGFGKAAFDVFEYWLFERKE